jgi:hypothetical protein
MRWKVGALVYSADKRAIGFLALHPSHFVADSRHPLSLLSSYSSLEYITSLISEVA